MNDHVNYRIHLCIATAVFIVFIALYVTHATWRFQLLRHQGEPAPTPLDLKPICSFNVFRDIARSRPDGFISGNGTWKRNKRGVPEHFQPEVCRFRHNAHIPKQEVLQCIKRHGLHYVVFAGDSNARRYFTAFQTLLTDVGAHCSALVVSILYDYLLALEVNIYNEQKIKRPKDR